MILDSRLTCGGPHHETAGDRELFIPCHREVTRQSVTSEQPRVR